MASAKRKDSKGRNLRDNEFQKKDGRYEYRFTDKTGKTKSVYSWRLVQTDKTPLGKREAQPLREMEAAIQRDMDANIIINRTATVDEYWQKMFAKKQGLKDYTRYIYERLYLTYIQEQLGQRKITEVKRIDIENFYIYAVNERGMKPNNLKGFHTVLLLIFDEALRDEIIRLNPVTGVVNDLKRRNIWKPSEWERKEKFIFSDEAQAKFINFLKTDACAKKWAPMFICFLGTGCRFGEMASLCWEDIDWKRRTISINKTIRYFRNNGAHSDFHITPPKTRGSIREIPMLSAVEAILKEEYKRQQEEGFCEVEIDGFTHFIWTTRIGKPYTSQLFDRKLQMAKDRYNKFEEEAANKENRTPVFLKHFSAHNLRHTFCTRFCQNEKDVKIVQSIMGHTCITTTMDIYNKCNAERKQKSLSELDGKFGI